MSKETYLNQKLGENRDKKYYTIIEVAEATDKGNYILVKGTDNKFYSHWPKSENDGWEKKIKVGEKINVFVNQKHNKSGKYPWRNIYPNVF